MNTNDVVKLATAYAAGTLAYDGLLEALGNDGDLADTVVALVASVGVAGLASRLADGTVELARDVPVVGGAIDLADSALDRASDVVDDVIDTLNPFSW